MPNNALDEVGLWTEMKLDIIRDYSAAYSKILSKQSAKIKHFAYIDAFAGPGHHVSRTTKKVIEGSPAIALGQRFDHYHFIDLDGEMTGLLTNLSGTRTDVTIYTGDCNKILLQDVFPQCRYEDRRRALCLLDPYDLNPSWEVVRTAAAMGSIEVVVNFMVMHANRDVLLKTGWENAKPAEIAKMDAFWGDESWREAAYRTERDLFGEVRKKARNEDLAEAYRSRLMDAAGFEYVTAPLPMRNSRGNIMYYLYFAGPNEVGYRIATSIFDKKRA
jgi:three-Cys-motif partner protein